MGDFIAYESASSASLNLAKTQCQLLLLGGKADEKFCVAKVLHQIMG